LILQLTSDGSFNREPPFDSITILNSVPVPLFNLIRKTTCLTSLQNADRQQDDKTVSRERVRHERQATDPELQKEGRQSHQNPERRLQVAASHQGMGSEVLARA
jgi:hypothetical protein